MITREANSEYRQREHLTGAEIERLIKYAKLGRHGQRDATLILTMYRHGLRAIEAADLEWSSIDWKAAMMHVTRAKGSKPGTHPIMGDELRSLRALQRETEGAYVFQTERGTPFDANSINTLIKRIGIKAKMPFSIHAHMLRHSTGFYLANKGTDTRTIQDYLGHVNIQHTVRYTELAPTRFKGLWRD